MPNEMRNPEQRKYSRAYRAKLIADPICSFCKKVPHLVGRIACFQCTAEMAQADTRYRTERREARIAANLCTECGKVPPTPGIKKCALCRDRRKAAVVKHQTKKRLEAKTLGLCVECRAQLDRKGFYCSNCLIHHRVRRYKGLTAEHLSTMSKTCQICGTDKKIFIDHDHKTNAVRGMLCQDCNMGLGQFRDSIDRLRNAIKYLGYAPDPDDTPEYGLSTCVH